MPYKDYTYFISRVAALVGTPVDTISDDENAIMNAGLNRAVKEAWDKTNWIDLCPNGEARFVGNLLTYPTA